MTRFPLKCAFNFTHTVTRTHTHTRPSTHSPPQLQEAPSASQHLLAGSSQRRRGRSTSLLSALGVTTFKLQPDVAFFLYCQYLLLSLVHPALPKRLRRSMSVSRLSQASARLSQSSKSGLDGGDAPPNPDVIDALSHVVRVVEEPLVMQRKSVVASGAWRPDAVAVVRSFPYMTIMDPGYGDVAPDCDVCNRHNKSKFILTMIGGCRGWGRACVGPAAWVHHGVLLVQGQSWTLKGCGTKTIPTPGSSTCQHLAQWQQSRLHCTPASAARTGRRCFHCCCTLSSSSLRP